MTSPPTSLEDEFAELTGRSKTPLDRARLGELLDGLRQLHDRMRDAERDGTDGLARLHPEQQASARNLLHYLAMRRDDLRPLQDELARNGLSSLGRCEAHVMDNLHAVIRVLARLVDGDVPLAPLPEPPVDFGAGRRLLEQRTRRLFGSDPRDRGVHIMVTMPSEAADNYRLVSDLVAQGMDCMRINCAHDDAAVWAKMIEHLRRAERELDRECRVFMDLGGPKLRTGQLGAIKSALRIRPRRDSLREGP